MKILWFIVLMAIAGDHLHADLPPLDPALAIQRRAVVEYLFAKQDVEALSQILKTEHLFIQREAALKLGRLGAEKALPALRELDKSYSRFACSESGQFGVVVLLIENRTKEAQKNVLLRVAVEPWTKGPHAQSVIDEAGRELSRFEGEDIPRALKEINTYGAQYTVLSHKCKKLSKEKAVSVCLAALHAGETPQKVKAAEDLLITYGSTAKSKLEKLKKKNAVWGRNRYDVIPDQINPIEKNEFVR